MLHCTACIRRCLRSLLGDAIDLGIVPKAHLAPSTTQIPARYSRWSRRSYATAAAAYNRNPVHEQYGVGQMVPAIGRFGQLGSERDPQRFYPSLSRHQGRGPAVDEKESSEIAQVTQFDRKALDKELRYLKDPLKLADHTIGLLKTDDQAKAYELVKISSKSMACTVCWNHLMDYEMAKGRVANAMKIYNDMKKRAQVPDAHTFTILLRGLAWHTNYPSALQRALSLYHSMYADNSPVRPSIIHTNAVLKVCARAKDLDSLWGVAARLPTGGRSAPDAATFTTILNAVYRVSREIARGTDQRGDEGVPQEEKMDQLQRAVLQGRRMWAEIVERWRNGDIRLDEDLVCSMGRLLMLSEVPKDLDDILSLLEQTMGVKRQAARLDPEGMKHQPSDKYLSLSSPDPSSAPEAESTEIIPAPNHTDRPFASADDEFVPGQEFDAVARYSSNASGYVVPSQNTLSLIVDACTRLHKIPAAQNYWGLLTSAPYNITPDTDNYHIYLRLLRLQRASRLCVELVQEMREGLGVSAPVEYSERRGVKGEDGGVQPKTFRIAMSTCIRDMNNPNVLQHAGKLCRMMIDCLPTPDMRAFSMFLDIGLKNAAAQNDWRMLSSVLRGTELGVRNLRNHIHFEEWGTGNKEERETLRSDLRAFLRKMIGAYDYLINGSGKEMMHDELRKCKDMRNTVAAWETRLGRAQGDVNGQKLRWEKGKDKEGEREMLEIRGRDGDRRMIRGKRDGSLRRDGEGERGRSSGRRPRPLEDGGDSPPNPNDLGRVSGMTWWGRRPESASEPSRSSGGQRKRMLAAYEARAKIEAEW